MIARKCDWCSVYEEFKGPNRAYSVDDSPPGWLLVRRPTEPSEQHPHGNREWCDWCGKCDPRKDK